jgi:hypothetical protein
MNYQRTMLLALLLLIGSAVHAQPSVKPCTTNKNSPPASTWHWPADTRVKVFFMKGMFTPPEQQAIREVMEQWNVWSEQVGAGIRYDFAGEVGQHENGEGCLTLTRIEIMKGTNNRYYAYFFPTRNPDGSIRSAQITFDFKTTDMTALKSIVAHELGHGMGLWDCKSCKGKSTIMNGFQGVNQGNGLVAPSACDIQVVKTLFDQERRLAQILLEQTFNAQTVKLKQ